VAEVHNLRDEASGDETLQKSAELACEVGQTIEVWDDDISLLPEGDYDVLATWQHLTVRGNIWKFRSRLRVRRVA
jgi:hypothetical protein